MQQVTFSIPVARHSMTVSNVEFLRAKYNGSQQQFAVILH